MQFYTNGAIVEKQVQIIFISLKTSFTSSGAVFSKNNSICLSSSFFEKILSFSKNETQPLYNCQRLCSSYCKRQPVYPSMEGSFTSSLFSGACFQSSIQFFCCVGVSTQAGFCLPEKSRAVAAHFLFIILMRISPSVYFKVPVYNLHKGTKAGIVATVGRAWVGNGITTII